MTSLLLLVPIASFAHPGRTDSYGCHTCRTNCPSWGLSSGEYHCHHAKALPQPEPPIRSRYGEYGTGYTEPAPDYAKPVSPVTPTLAPKPVPSYQPQSPQYAPEPKVEFLQPKKESVDAASPSNQLQEIEEKYSPSQQAAVVHNNQPQEGFWKRLFGWFANLFD